MTGWLAQVEAPYTGPTWGDQYLDGGWFGILFVLVLVAFILVNISRAGKGKDLFIRRIPGLNAIDEAIGRATEMGRPVLMVPGLSASIDAIVVQAVNIFAYVSRIAAKFSNPILLCCYNAATYTLAQEVIRDVYQQEGMIEKYDPDSVRFISDRQFAFAAGVSGLILREQTAATFFLGEFYAESLIFAETANSIGAIQVASSTQVTQTPFFIAACDYVLIGDEFYAASAYLTRQPVLVGSLVGQDWCKMAVMASIAAGVIVTSLHIQGDSDARGKKDADPPTISKNVPAGSPVVKLLKGELTDPDAPARKVTRPKDPNAPASAPPAGGEK